MDWNDPELKAMREEFVASFAERRARLAPLLKGLGAAPAPARAAELMAELRLVAHKLAGVAGSYGFAGLTRVAAALDDYLSGPGPLRNAARAHACAKLMDEMLESCEATGEDSDADRNDPRMLPKGV